MIFVTLLITFMSDLETTLAMTCWLCWVPEGACYCHKSQQVSTACCWALTFMCRIVSVNFKQFYRPL